MIPRQPAGVPVFGCCSTIHTSAPCRVCLVRVSTASMVPIPPDHVNVIRKMSSPASVMNSLLGTAKGEFLFEAAFFVAKAERVHVFLCEEQIHAHSVLGR